MPPSSDPSDLAQASDRARASDCAREVDALLTRVKAGVDPYLDQLLPPTDQPPAELHRAMRHLLLPGGKRLRPAFAVAACEAFGGSLERALPAAAAVELIHTYSLVHDDLPCMDDDAERRGLPTAHVAYGEATALLAGDALQAAAFEVLAAAKADPAAILGATLELARASGSLALVGGQVDDLAFTAGGIDEQERVEGVHRRKSAALIAASVGMGARLGGAQGGALDSLRAFGEEVGIAFQIADDLLDAEDGDEPCSSVRVLGPVRARERAEELLESALARIAGLDEGADPLRQLARFSVRRDR